MRFKLLTFLILINTSIGYSQKIIVESIKLIETVDNRFVSEIPKVKDLTNDNNPVVMKINSVILDRFMISSFEQNDLDEFRWYEVKSSSDIKDNILYISFSGEYYGAYPNYVEDEFYFDINSGETLTKRIIPFQALFTLNGYLEFLNKYWLEGIRKEFKTAIECTETDSEPYCSYYDIYSYSVTNGKLSISLAEDCYPRVLRACTPFYSISVELDSISDYLNDLGKHLLISSEYLSMSAINVFIENEKLKDSIENNMYIFGRIDDKYPFSMAINIDKRNQINGYYYYDNKMQRILLKGQLSGNIIQLTEFYDNKQTGQIEFKIKDEYDSNGYFLYDPNGQDKYVVGNWTNPLQTKSFGIKMTEIKTCDKN